MFKGYFGLIMLSIIIFLLLNRGTETVSIVRALANSATQGIKILQGR